MRAIVCGYGRMGTFHAKVLRDLGYHVETVDPDPARGADHLAIPYGEWDVAAIATPIDALGQAACALADTPRLLVEKPFALSASEAVALRDMLPLGVCVGFVERFNPAVRRLYEWLDGRTVEHANFTRWSDRPSADVRTDLRIHDVDLARHLGVLDVATFDTLARTAMKRRTIEVHTTTGRYCADLMAHDTSPLHALWHTYLMGGDVPTPDDAIAALRFLSQP